jgi:hypothetical protein
VHAECQPALGRSSSHSLTTLFGMPRRSTEYGKPCDWVAEGEWPTGVFRPDTPDIVAYPLALAEGLRSALGGINKSQLCADAHIERSTLYDILDGNTWADLVTIAKIETSLGKRIWPTKPSPLPRQHEPGP